MTSTHVLLIATVTWLWWIPAAVLGKHARGDAGSTSIFPVIPLYPLAAWGAALLLGKMHLKAGVFVIGGGHIILFTLMSASVLKSLVIIRGKQKVNRLENRKRRLIAVWSQLLN